MDNEFQECEIGERKTSKESVSRMMVRNGNIRLGEQNVGRLQAPPPLKGLFSPPYPKQQLYCIVCQQSPISFSLASQSYNTGNYIFQANFALRLLQGYILTQFLTSSFPDIANVLLDGHMVSNHLLIHPSQHLKYKNHFITDTSMVTAHQLNMQNVSPDLHSNGRSYCKVDSSHQDCWYHFLCIYFVTSHYLYFHLYDLFSLLTCHFLEGNVADGGVLYLFLLNHAMPQFLIRLENKRQEIYQEIFVASMTIQILHFI